MRCHQALDTMAGVWTAGEKAECEMQQAMEESRDYYAAQENDRESPTRNAQGTQGESHNERACDDDTPDIIAAPFAEPNTPPSAFRTLATGYFGTTVAEAREISDACLRHEAEEEERKTKKKRRRRKKRKRIKKIKKEEQIE